MTPRTPLVSRSAAGLRPPRRVTPNRAATMLTGHYLGPSPWGNADRSTPERFAATTDHARCPTLWRGVQAYHYRPGTNAADVFYNSAVCPHAVRYEGRGPGVLTGANGTATGNAQSHAVLYMGGEGDPLTAGAMIALVDEEHRYGLPMLRDHSRWKATACAGHAVRAWIAAGRPDPGAMPAPTPPPVEGPARAARKDRDTMMHVLRDSTTLDVWLIIPGVGEDGRPKVTKLKDPLTFLTVEPGRLQYQVPMLEAPTMRWIVWEHYLGAPTGLRPDQGGRPNAPF